MAQGPMKTKTAQELGQEVSATVKDQGSMTSKGARPKGKSSC